MQSVLMFDGKDDYVEIPYNQSLNPNLFTVSSWVKVTGGQGRFRSVITSRVTKDSAGYIIYAGDNNKWQAWVGNGSDWEIVNNNDIPVVLNVWTHIASTFDGKQLKLYVDGKEVGSKNVVYAPNTRCPLRIGAGATEANPRYFYSGQITEVSVWNKALTAAEIQAKMNQYLTGKEDGLVAYLPLNEGSGNLVKEKTGNGINGTINGAVWQQEEIPLVKPETTPVLKSLGRIVVNADESTLSDQGIKTIPDAATFALNIAKYFVGENKGKFHVLSNNFGLTGASLEQTMTKAGHTWTKGMNIPINLETLQKYDGIFIGGDLVENQVLIEYVKNGGKVYLCAGTGKGGAQAEANNWNTFLAAFGLKIQGIYNAITGNIAVNNPNHSLFAGVTTLYQNNGNFITDLQTDSQLNQIILAHSSGKGLIGTAEFVKPSAPKSPA
ncbi:LamG domain-containing protein [Sphaerospermopsis sp. FACHB-1194]|uniref:LamG domain-containing protein n=1 Tax=Sphaerospermopsis sp. FACHB-1194 TaxID=2692862 RepID=UPI001681BE7F|nr:LamG domain-containing protein [Sphaerospermopsis sp. FACHB-1194]MBD2144469.1 LamG domain-containing protein [Sphaerospermopsis sp. FACHB-1194]